MKLKYSVFRNKAYNLLNEKGPMTAGELVARIDMKKGTPTPMQAGSVLRKDPRFTMLGVVSSSMGGHINVWRARTAEEVFR